MKVWDAEEVANDYYAAASVILGLDAEVNPPQAYIMQIPVPSLQHQVTHTRELCDNMTIYHRTGVSANATPKHTLVDLHHGMFPYRLAILITDRARSLLHRCDSLWKAENLDDVPSNWRESPRASESLRSGEQNFEML